MLHQKNINSSQFTTLRIGGVAENLFLPSNLKELISLVSELEEQKIPWSLLGAGSNTLVSSSPIKEAIIITTGISYWEKISPETVTVGLGMKMPKLASLMMNEGLSGCEFLEGIPGTIGGGVVMNAGANRHWVSDILEQVKVFDLKDKKIINISNRELAFDYRSSKIDPSRQIVLEAKLRLKTSFPKQIEDRMKQNRQIRAATQPRGFSSGCIFKNPCQRPAGKLIDGLGFKGEVIGGAQVSDIHANFILNTSKIATSDDICALIKQIQKRAWEQEKIWLKPEIKPLGDFKENKVIWLENYLLQEQETKVRSRKRA